MKTLPAPTDWEPELPTENGPRYQALAQALAEDIESGLLAPGTRLPTQRDLARRLRVTVGTPDENTAFLDALDTVLARPTPAAVPDRQGSPT